MSVMLACSSAAAQEAGRRWAFGEVVSADNQPAAGCAVVCAGQPWFGSKAEPDVVEVHADKRGVFTVKLLTDRSYQMIAFARQADGSTIRSPVAQIVRGARVRLRLHEAFDKSPLQVTGDLGLGDRGPVHFQRMDLIGRWLPVVLDKPLPLHGQIRAFDNRGTLRWQGHALASQLRLPTLGGLAIRVKSPTGRLLPMARISQVFGSNPATFNGIIRVAPRPVVAHLGDTDAEGMATVLTAIALQSMISSLHLQVEHKHHAVVLAGIAGLGSPPYVGNRCLQPTAEQVLDVEMPYVHPFGVTPARACAMTLLAAQPRGVNLVPRLIDVQTNATGKTHIKLQWYHGMPVIGRIDRADGKTFWTQVPWTKDGFVASLDARKVDIEVRNADGSPAPAATAWLIPHSSKQEFSKLPDLPVPLDRHGKATFEIGEGDWLALAVDDDKIGWTLLRATDLAMQRTIELHPMPRATVRFVDKDGQPLPFAAMPRAGGTARWAKPKDPDDYSYYVMQTRVSHPTFQQLADANGCVHYLLPIPGYTAHMKIAGQPVVIEQGASHDIVLR